MVAAAEVAAVPTATAGPAGSVCVAQQAAGSAAAKGWLENFTFPAPCHRSVPVVRHRWGLNDHTQYLLDHSYFLQTRSIE